MWYIIVNYLNFHNGRPKQPQRYQPKHSDENIVEEKTKNGQVINKYLKGRYLGKVIKNIFRVASLSAINLRKYQQAENMQLKL